MRLAASLALLLILIAAGCGREPDAVPAAEAQAEASPSPRLGARTTLAGEVAAAGGERWFALAGREGAPDELLVLTTAPVAIGGAALAAGDDVVVTGTRQPLDPAAIEADLGWALPAELAREHAGRDVLVADEVQQVRELGRWSAGGAERGTITSTDALFATPDPTPLAGAPIELDAAPVWSRARRALWLGHTYGPHVLVVPPEGGELDLAALQAGATVDVRGRLAPMPPVDVALKRYGIDRSLASELRVVPLVIEADALTRAADRRPGS